MKINNKIFDGTINFLKRRMAELAGFLLVIVSSLFIFSLTKYSPESPSFILNSEKIVFTEREINRLGNIKGTEDILNVAIKMVRQGNSKEEIINKTGLREDEVEAIYTYYKK